MSPGSGFTIIGFDIRRPLPNAFYDEPYAGVDDAGWDWPTQYVDESGRTRTPPTCYGNVGLMCDLEGARGVRSALMGSESSCLIAVGILNSEAWPEVYHRGSTTPSMPMPDWTLLGFDVANQWLESQFVSLGRTPDSPEPQMTSDGLIADLIKAALLRDHENNGWPVDSGGPLLVFAVYLIER